MSGWGEADEGDGGAATRATPVDALDRGTAAAALGLLGVLSLVLLAVPDDGLRVVLAQQRQAVAFLWQWRLAGLATIVVLYLLTDGARSVRAPEAGSRRWMLAVSSAWLGVLTIGTFGFHRGTADYVSVRHAVSVVATGVVMEELLHRGALFSLAERVRPVGRRLWTSFPVVVTTVTFTLGHLQSYHFDVGAAVEAQGYVWANGLVYGVLRARTRSIWPPLAVHSIGNALALLAGSL